MFLFLQDYPPFHGVRQVDESMLRWYQKEIHVLPYHTIEKGLEYIVRVALKIDTIE